MPVAAANPPALLKCDTNFKCDSKDLVSNLPNDVLVAILCLLTCKEAAATSVLSRRWVDLWKSIPVLNFDDFKALRRVSLDHGLLKIERAKFINSVNQVLAVHEGLAIDEFRVCFDLSKANKRDIHNWLKFAFAKRVQRLLLDFTTCRMFAHKHEEIHAFNTQFCFVQPCTSSTFVDFEPLKTLSFTSVNVTADTLVFLLSNCHFLESLHVRNSAGLKNLEVSGKSLRLRDLAISSCKNLESIKIFGTNLVKFYFKGNVDALFLHDLPFLVEASIMEFQFATDFFPRFSSCLRKLEILKLSCRHSNWTWNSEELPRLPSLKQLSLLSFSMFDIRLRRCISNLIDAFPCLQNLVIELWWENPRRSGRKVSENIPFHPHKSLKVVKLAGYYGRSSDLELVMYFLKNAVALEQLIIDPHNPGYNSTQLPKSTEVNVEETIARTIAKQQLEGITSAIHPSIKLMIL